ncbi:MAG TPA: serine/threonine-protein kinase [Luteolibacter sp.]
MSSAAAPFEAPSLETLNALLPAYAFEQLIAQGGMGAVYKARQRSLDRDVAVKILPPVFSADADFRKSFETEARAMARMNHPNLISVIDSGDLGDMLYIVMEYVPGKSLYHSAYGMRVDPVQAVELVIGICHGLAHAHDNGVLHRDIKPANILLTAKAEPKIGDFGLALPSDADGPGLIMGTPGYTAPELMRHPESADRRSDLYAVGVILYELLTGERHRPDSRPPSLVCGCDPAFDRICQRATNPNPGLRYPDGHAFASELEGWLKQHRPRTSAAPARPGHQAPPMRTPAARQAPPVIRRSHSGALAGRLLLLAALGAGGYFAWQNREALAASFSGKKETPATPVSTEALAPPPPLEKLTPGPEAFEEQSSTQAELKIEDTLTPKARELIARGEAGRTKQLEDNLRWLADNLSRWARNAPAHESDARENHIARFRAVVQKPRVPTGSTATFPSEMQQLIAQAVERQNAIDAAYTLKVGHYRDLYVEKMRAKLEAAQDNGQTAIAAELERRLETAGDLDTWIRAMGGTVPAPDNGTKQGALDSVFGSPEP